MPCSPKSRCSSASINSACCPSAAPSQKAGPMSVPYAGSGARWWGGGVEGNEGGGGERGEADRETAAGGLGPAGQGEGTSRRSESQRLAEEMFERLHGRALLARDVAGGAGGENQSRRRARQ